jgi:poly-gamma-glutamate synthesis protein (capsule biosynthesis protein)
MRGNSWASRSAFFAVTGALVVAAAAVAISGRSGETGSPSNDARPVTSVAPTPANRAAGQEPAARRGRLVIHAAGDVSLDPGYISTYSTHGFGYAWSGLGGLFARDDLTIVNVECPVSDRGEQLDKDFSFHGSPEALPAMERAGVEVASLANNHAYDRGRDALVDSVRNVRRARIEPVGAGRNAHEALSPALFRMKGWKIAVLGFDEVTDPAEEVAGPDKPGTAAGHDFPQMVKAVRAASREADIVAVMIHWGVELDTEPRDYQMAEARRLIEAGADMIFGSHSHRLQPVSILGGHPVYWSLGNFVWPNFSTEGSTTGVAQVVLTPKGRLVPTMIPAFIEEPGHPVLR